MESHSVQNILDNRINRRNITLKAKCIKSHESNLACNNSHCKQYAFVCNNRNCECRILHKKCLYTCTDQILQLIEQKRSQSTDVIDKVCLVLDKWIDQISKTRQTIQDILIDWGLSGAQKKFIDLIKKQEYKQLTGHHIHQITTQSVQYFSQEVKQRLFRQIQKVQQNYDSQIKAISKTVISLFEKYQIQEKDVIFKDQKKISLDLEYQFLYDFQIFRKNQLVNIDGKFTQHNYQKFVSFIKNALKKDFQAHMNKYRKNRRAYGSKKLRQKYFDDYIDVVCKGKQYMDRWQLDTKNQIQHISKKCQKQIQQMSRYYHQLDGQVQKPFTVQMAFSLQKAINIMQMLVDFIKVNGKQKLQILMEKDKRLDDTFEIVMYFLDQIMDDHPQIDQVDAIWTVIRFQDKLKTQSEMLYSVIKQVKGQVYNYEVNNV